MSSDAVPYPPAPGARIFVGLSGGVDSAVAALLLKRQGYEVTGLFMQNWEEIDGDGRCSVAEDLADAQAVCERLDLPLQTANFAEEYWARVFSRFLDEHRAGRTPNPDVLCNREIKFDLFLKLARQRGADAIATGHYARIAPYGDGLALRRAADRGKDQTYFLHSLGPQELSRSLFPLAGLAKREVREIAHREGLPVANKKDSTGICFIGERPFQAFLAEYLPEAPGEIVDETGRVLGEHVGLAFYTLGQRQGLGIGGLRGARGPWFVAAKQMSTNRLVVVQGHDHPLLLSSGLVAQECSWVAGAPPGVEFACSLQTRYRQRDQPCRVRLLDTGQAEVRFEQPQRAVTPGQFAVFYDGDRCLGGALITESVALAAGEGEWLAASNAGT